MPTYRDDAIVLHTTKLGEADRIITMLTKNHGKIRAVAKGVRKSTSRYGARLEPLNLIDVQLHQGRNLDTVTGVDTVAAFSAQAIEDYSIWTAGLAMAETTDRIISADREPANAQFLLFYGGLKALVDKSHSPGLILDAFLIRSMAIAGWAASFDKCAKCDAPGPHNWFSVTNGGVLCSECKIPGSATPAPETLSLLGALLSGDWKTADASAEKNRKEATGIVAAHLQWHLEREVKSLKHVERRKEDSNE